MLVEHAGKYSNISSRKREQRYQLMGAIVYFGEILDLLEQRRKLPWLLILFLSSSVLDIFGLGLIGTYVSF